MIQNLRTREKRGEKATVRVVNLLFSFFSARILFYVIVKQMYKVSYVWFVCEERKKTELFSYNLFLILLLVSFARK